MKQDVATIPHSPNVFTRDGSVFTNSNEVAKYFAKRHDNVVASILKLIADGVTYFTETSYLDGKTGKVFKSFDMSRSGFVLLAMGFTGTRALRWKIAYLEAFDAMEAMIRQSIQAPTMVIDYDDNDFLRHVIVGVGAKLAEKEQQLQIAHVEIAAAKTEIAVVKTELQAVSVKAKLWERYLDADGHMILSDAAKLLGVSHGKFFKRLVEAKILFYRDPERKRGLRASQKYEDKGYFVLKGGVTRANNFSFLQTYVAKDGVEFLAVFFERIDLFNQLQRS